MADCVLLTAAVELILLKQSFSLLQEEEPGSSTELWKLNDAVNNNPHVIVSHDLCIEL